MTLLTVCQNVADEIGIKKPTSVISSTDATTVRIYRQAVRVGTVLAKKNWHELMKEHSFSTSAAEPQYDFPSDYRSMIPDTAWNQTTDKQIILISPTFWSYEKSVTTATFEDRFRLMGDDAGPDVGRRFTLHPTPSSVETIYYQYYSKNWVEAADSTQKASFTLDSDTIAFDEDLFEMGVLWRVLKQMGQTYEQEKVDYDTQLEICLAQSGATERLHADGNRATLSNIPETGFG